MSFTYTKPARKLTWLITGCSSGFGLSLTRFAQAGGQRVIATSRNPSRTPELVAEIERNGGKWLQLDVTSLGTAKIIEDLEKSGEKIDVLVNNAGYSIHAPVELFTEEEVRAQLETLYLGPLRLIRAVLPHMRERRFGVVVNISTGAALGPHDGMGAYGGAKAGLDGITRALTKEVGPFNIRTLTAILGTFNTDFGKGALEGATPITGDYEGSPSQQLIQWISSGKFVPSGDKEKAMKALYEIVVGEGVGVGKENEIFLPLGPDMINRVKGVQKYLAHSVEVFGDISENLTIDK
ncbi:hypothetical protein G7046_g3970 [Stylonectria norvegica]|nr:hypothetical protein G7046_g3970 [Stylonectria norvegica]